jgi:hypothetical protein
MNQEYINELYTITAPVTYEIYCDVLNTFIPDTLTEGFFDNIRHAKLSRELFKVFTDLRNNMENIAKESKMNFADLVQAFKSRDVFAILKSFGFSIGLMFQSILAFTGAVRGGLLEIFRDMHRRGVFQQLRKGAIKIDEVMKRYPKLTRVTGIIIAGLLLYMWLNMTFIGDLDYDFNFSDIHAALLGTFSIANLFASPEGLMLITLFGTGAALGISFPWLGKSLYNFVVALIYTVYARMKGKKDISVVKSLRSKIAKGKLF